MERTARTEMENGGCGEWKFRASKQLMKVAGTSIRTVLETLMTSLNKDDPRTVIPLGHGDPSAFPCFRTTPTAEDALISSIRSGKNNHYSPTVGLLPARRAVSEYLSHDLPYKLSPDDIYLTIGCSQAIEIALTVLARPGCNILLPRPGFPYYNGRAAFSDIEVRYFDLLPERNWEVDLDGVESLTDENTVAMVIINPVNPCGNVFSYQHLAKVAETARKLGILILADEVYAHLVFGDQPFVPMGTFGSIVPVLTLGSISKRWVVPGWRLGWLVTCDPNRILEKTKIVDCIKSYLNVSSDPATITQAAIPEMIEKTSKDFFDKTNQLLKQTADTCYDGIIELNCISCPHKPEGSMFVMVKLDVSHLEDINDDMDFCIKLAKEESVIVMPGTAVGMKNWLRVTFAVEPSLLAEGILRLKAFCQRHAKQQ